MLKKIGNMTVRDAGMQILKGLVITLAISGSMIMLFALYAGKVGHPIF